MDYNKLHVLHQSGIRWVGHVECMEEKRSESRVLEKRTERHHLET